MVTLEEEHSTRGRAHMLFEVLQGEVVHDAWKDEHVKKALDLCLSARPANRNARPTWTLLRTKPSFGPLLRGQEAPSSCVCFRNDRSLGATRIDCPVRRQFFSQAPGFRHLLQGALHLARSGACLSSPAPHSKTGLEKIEFPASEKTPSLLPPEHRTRAKLSCGRIRSTITFIPIRAVPRSKFSRPAGFHVTVPQIHLCCGRPLYDFGMLDRAKEYLERIMSALSVQIMAGIPIVVLEPSCASVFRDELRNLFPMDQRATRLRSQTFLLSEFLEHHAPGYEPPQLGQKVLLHGHCHHKSIMKLNDEESLLRKMGADLQSMDSGCCGMAGPFGFERDKYAYPRP